MKKIILLICLLFFTTKHFAQLPDGSTAPDFTAVDLNGNSHTLSSYLNAGKTVILEFSGVGCGPCWNYKKREALQDLYNAFGPPGSNELMVLQIEDYYYESNYNETYNELHGISATGSDEFGNWVEGTPFPIIMSYVISAPYLIEYIPTIFRVCPDGKTFLIGQVSAVSAKAYVNSGCSVLTGVQNYGRVLETINAFCTPQGGFEAQFKNYGVNNILSAVFKLKKNGTVISTVDYTGSLTQFGTGTVSFEEILVDASAQYTVEIESINGASNFNPQFSQASLPFHISAPSGIELQIKIHANDTPENMRWNITGSTGIVAAEGPYTVPNPDTTYNYYTNTIIEHNVVLPDTEDCYTLNLFSSGGYGWKRYYWGTPLTVTPGIEVFSGGNLIYSNLNVGNFGNSLAVENFLSTGMLSVDRTDAEAFTVFPNPTSGALQIKGEGLFEVSVFDIMGKEVFRADDVNTNNILDISQLGNGIYMARFLDENGFITTHKIIVDHNKG
jgi:Secretion system C-terminal sorting domain/AhpC/TSA family